VSQEANYSVTFKSPKGNLITVRGDTASEWKRNLEAAASDGALTKIVEIEAILAGQKPQAAPPQAAPATQATASQPAQELPGSFAVKCDTCQAPTRFDKEGVSKQSGRPYKRYVCTANALHKATFTD
jgi:hypothetical protein